MSRVFRKKLILNISRSTLNFRIRRKEDEAYSYKMLYEEKRTIDWSHSFFERCVMSLKREEREHIYRMNEVAQIGKVKQKYTHTEQKLSWRTVCTLWYWFLLQLKFRNKEKSMQSIKMSWIYLIPVRRLSLILFYILTPILYIIVWEEKVNNTFLV